MGCRLTPPPSPPPPPLPPLSHHRTATQGTQLHCIELQCIANCWYALLSAHDERFCVSRVQVHDFFLKCWSQKGSDLECVYLLKLRNSWERNYHHILLFVLHSWIYWIIYLLIIPDLVKKPAHMKSDMWRMTCDRWKTWCQNVRSQL